MRNAKIIISKKAIQQILENKENLILKKESKETLKNRKLIILKSTKKVIVKNKENLLKKKSNLDIVFVLLLSTIYFINVKKYIYLRQ